MHKIDRFDGEYRFLSNFYNIGILYEGLLYPSVEHAYQAAKTLSHTQRVVVLNMVTPGRAKRMGQQLILREDWEDVKLSVMETLLREKFRQAYLKSQLLKTFPAELEEGNTWGDRYWGVCGGVGENHLGRLLMKIRKELKDATPQA